MEENLCIVRAYRDKPCISVVTEMGGRLVYVVNPSSRNAVGTAVGFPRKDTFEYESTLFEQMSRAFDAEDKNLLAQLWARATPLVGGSR